MGSLNFIAATAAFLTIMGGHAAARTAVVTHNNVLLRDSPEKDYVVEMVLHRGCRVETDTLKGSVGHARFTHILFRYSDSLKVVHSIYGWVEQRYLTYDTLAIAPPKTHAAYTTVPLTPYGGSREHNPNKDNRRSYPASRYRGGDPQPAPWVRKYQMGNRGGCFYLNPKGKKVYVDKKYCTDPNKRPAKKTGIPADD